MKGKVMGNMNKNVMIIVNSSMKMTMYTISFLALGPNLMDHDYS